MLEHLRENEREHTSHMFSQITMTIAEKEKNVNAQYKRLSFGLEIAFWCEFNFIYKHKMKSCFSKHCTNSKSTIPVLKSIENNQMCRRGFSSFKLK